MKLLLKMFTGNRWAALAAGLILLAVACGGSDPTASPSDSNSESPGSTPVSTAEPAAQNETPIGPDTSIHSVPLDQILFDTFGTTSARFVPLSGISEELQADLRDAISPVTLPAYGASDALPWLDDDDLVLGYESADEAFAYPINILNFHEIVNDTIAGVPVLITYCPLCFSGVVFSRVLDGQTLTFGNTSALYQSDLVMYDHQTGSYWFQVGGEAVVGTLTGSRLRLLASTTMPWGRWKKLHPDTLLITGSKVGDPTMFTSTRYGNGFSSDYQDRIDDEQFAFPVDEEKLDGRLSAGEIVLSVENDAGAKAFPLGVIGDAAVNAEVGGEPVVVFTASGGRTVGSFSRTINGETLTFSRQNDEIFTDSETGSSWDFAGRAVDGQLEGARLERVSSRRAFWFSVAISFPGIEIHTP